MGNICEYALSVAKKYVCHAEQHAVTQPYPDFLPLL